MGLLKSATIPGTLAYDSIRVLDFEHYIKILRAVNNNMPIINLVSSRELHSKVG